MVVLASKCYVAGESRERAVDGLRSLVDDAIGDLDVSVEIGVRADDFPAVTVQGEDAVIARNILREEWGEIVHQHAVGDVHVGTLESWDDDGVVLDAGTPVRIAAEDLGLGPGTPSQVRQRFGLVQHLALHFEVTETDDGQAIRGALAERERDRLHDWRRGNGRITVNSTTRSEVRATLNRAGHSDDYVTVERLGLLEHSIICREGTDPPGLLASIGQYLQAELLCVVP